MPVAPDAITTLAALARIDLADQEAKTFSQQLPKVVEYVGQLQQAETHHVPTEDVPSQPLRPDETADADLADAMLNQAPDRDDRAWKVKSVW